MIFLIFRRKFLRLFFLALKGLQIHVREITTLQGNAMPLGSFICKIEGIGIFLFLPFSLRQILVTFQSYCTQNGQNSMEFSLF